VTARSGITFVHTDGGSGQRYIVETVSCGLALLDYDGDGDIDIYFLNGAPLPVGRQDHSSRNALYQNEGNWRFVDQTESAGVGDSGYSLGVCVGDYDNDGDPDLYVNNFGPNILYRNNGNGTFTDVTAAAGVGNGRLVGAGACFLDIEQDGDLDLYVGNYIDFTCEKNKNRLVNGHPAYVGPMTYGPVPDTLFRNNGDGTFTDISEVSGVAAHSGTSMGMICADYDDDGDTDVIVGNDAMGNFALANDGAGFFEEIALLAGLAYDRHGVGQGTMGVECGDYDNDGRLDFYMTSYQKQWATLYRNSANGLFVDVTHASGAGAGTFPNVTWGTGMVDFDNDGDRDLFVACGHLQDTVDRWDDSTSYRARNLLLVNNGEGKFEELSAQSGTGLMPRLSSRGAAFDDLDNDGDIDVVVLNSRARPTLLRNDSQGENHWLRLHLRGTTSNRDGVGARIKLTAGDLHLTDEIFSGRGYQSSYAMQPHFGLGSHTRVERVEVRWPDGTTQVLRDVKANQLLVITQSAPSR
jgi:hypothetical protein